MFNDKRILAFGLLSATVTPFNPGQKNQLAWLFCLNLGPSFVFGHLHASGTIGIWLRVRNISFC